MEKKSALFAWDMLLMSLPKGIMAFVIVVTGLCVSLPLVILWVGLPMLGATLAACRWMMGKEQQFVEGWIHNRDPWHRHSEDQLFGRWEGIRSLLTLLGQGKTYLSILYSLLQLPIGIAAFTVGIVLPVTSFAVMLSPLAQKVSMDFFSFDLFESSWSFYPFYLDFSSTQQSWIAGGVGMVLLLLQPMFLRALGRLYAGYIQLISN